MLSAEAQPVLCGQLQRPRRGYENRREGDRIIRDANLPIRGNQYNAYAYSPDTFPSPGVPAAVAAPLPPSQPEVKATLPTPIPAPRAETPAVRPRADAPEAPAGNKAHAEANEGASVPMPLARPSIPRAKPAPAPQQMRQRGGHAPTLQRR